MISFNLMSPLTGKTLILEAATQSLSKKINTEVVFVMALGEAGTKIEITEKLKFLKFTMSHFSRL